MFNDVAELWILSSLKSGGCHGITSSYLHLSINIAEGDDKNCDEVVIKL
jgi:hypothetical protein